MQALSSRLRDLHVKRIIRDPGSVSLVLRTWEPEMEGSAEFLQLLTGKMSVKWWLRRNPAVRMEILSELIRIDGGRKVIADWLASVVREEIDLSVLNTAAGWISWGYPFSDGLLDAWYDRSLDGLSNTAAIRKTALHTLINTTFPSGISSGNADGMEWNEERKAKIILNYLNDLSGHLRAEPSTHVNAEHIVEGLEILSDWKPSPSLHGKDVLSEIFGQWERHMAYIAGIMAENRETTGNNQKYNNQEYLNTTWKGLTRLSPYCADPAGTGGRLLFWMEYWLQCDRDHLVSSKIISGMADWNPPDDTLREKAALLWSRYLLSSHGYENPSVWAALGRYFSGCRQPGPEGDEIVRNVLGALQLVPKIRGRARAWVMGAIVRPPWLTAEQQMEWKNLWDNLMKSSSAATLYLLELSSAGLADPNDVKKTVLKRLEKRLENLDKIKDEMKAVAFIFELMRSLEQSKRIRNFPVEIFHDVWVNLRQCSWWKSPRVRVAAIEGLATCLKSNPVWRENLPGLESLWLETLRGESHPLTVQALQKKQSEIMEICPGFCPDSMPIWKALGRSEDAQIRCTAWKFFISLGDKWKDDIGAFLLERLREERNMDVLETMAEWKPSSGQPFPPGFLEGWTDCFQGVMAGIMQSVASGQSDRDVAKWEMEEIIHAVKVVTLIRILNIAWLEERPGFDSQPAKLADLRAFWETLAETMKAFPDPDGEIIGEIETAWKDLRALFQLGESPEKFLDSFTQATFNNFYYKNPMLWKDLVRDLAGKDLSPLAVNVRHNLGVVVASLMAWPRCITKETQQVFMELCGDGTWTPDRVPAGWERFCHEFRRICRETSQKDSKTGKIEEIYGMIRMGHTIGDERCHELFRQTLYQVLESVNPVLASVLEGALWREIARSAETAERFSPDGRGLDEAGQRRWLRQFILAHGQTHGTGEDSQVTGGFWNLLWTGLNLGLSPQAGTGVRPACRTKVFTLSSERLVFLHPHRDGGRDASQPVWESDRLVQTNSRRGQQPLLFPAG